MVGGPGSSGILLAKKNIMISRKPHRPGGGSISYVNVEDHDYCQNVEELEEAGTSGIL